MSAQTSPEVLGRFEYVRPTALAEAIDLLAANSVETWALAGGTDLAVTLRQRRTNPSVVVDLKLIPELSSGIVSIDGSVVINANTPMTVVERDEQMNARYPGVVESVRVVGSVQIRNRATLAGNLCNASPAADTPPMLLALGASVEVSGPTGNRAIDLEHFFTGYRETALGQGEIVRAVTIPKKGPRTGTAFLKLGVRKAMEISVVCVGAMVELAEDDSIRSAGIGLGSVAPTTVRARGSVETLVGEMPTPKVFAAASAEALQDANPIDDLRASAEYRRAMVPVLVGRALSIAAKRAGQA